MRTLLQRVVDDTPHITLTGDELGLVIKALQRSSQAMPEQTETILSRNVRQSRETKLADRIRRAY